MPDKDQQKIRDIEARNAGREDSTERVAMTTPQRTREMAEQRDIPENRPGAATTDGSPNVRGENEESRHHKRSGED